jgi:hypothetical protein
VLIAALAVLLAVDEPVPATPPEPDPLFRGPKVVVPAPVRGGAPVPAAHKPLVDALRKRFGERVLDTAVVVQAQLDTNITAVTLKPPPETSDGSHTGPPPPAALARLGEALGAERAILVEIKPNETLCLVYPGLTGNPAIVVHVPKKKADFLNAKWADAIADEIVRLGEGALEDPPKKDIKDPEAERQAAEDARQEILAEERRDRERKDRLAAQKAAEEGAQDPLVMGLIGGGGAMRFFGVGGAGADALAPLNNGVVPVASVFIAGAPVRAIPALRASKWTDVLVEAGYRRGFAVVSGKDVGECNVDDDDAFGRASWRVIPVDGAWVPRVGGGLGGGVERVELGCDLPVVSTRYPNGFAFARITQPLVPRTAYGPMSLIELDALAGYRAVLVPDGVTPSVAGDLFVVFHPLRFVVARAGTRVTYTHVESGTGKTALVVDDTRASFELQIGGAF